MGIRTTTPDPENTMLVSVGLTGRLAPRLKISIKRGINIILFESDEHPVNKYLFKLVVFYTETISHLQQS